ncbi:MAG: STAS domain-containing protein [Ruminiclostridium sp.]|nr:STAS domain-containing protein [Ruminiclostridium sp.]
MDIRKAEENGKLTIALIGRVDTVTAPELEKELKADYEAIDSLVMDFAEVEYISSAGLRVLLSAHKAMNKKGGMKLKNVNDDVMEIFDVTGFSDILTIE